jgi:hypothetical protein
VPQPARAAKRPRLSSCSSGPMESP